MAARATRRLERLSLLRAAGHLEVAEQASGEGVGDAGAKVIGLACDLLH
jgi:hypothetical protein